MRRLLRGREVLERTGDIAPGRDVGNQGVDEGRHDVALAHAEEALGGAVDALDAAEVVHRNDAVLDVVQDGLQPDHAFPLEALRHRRRLVGGEAHHGLEAGAVVLVGVVLAADDVDEPAQLHLAGGVGGFQQLLLQERVDGALARWRDRRLRVGKRGRVRFRGLLQHHDFPSAVRRHSDPKHMPAALPGNAT